MKQVKAAVRADMRQLTPGDLILVACSGGADSMALAIAALEVAPEFAIRVGVVVIDHQLQHGSGEVSQNVVSQLSARGANPALLVRVDVDGEGGLEASARTARYHALDQVRADNDAAAVYLGHTASDQAETVLLGLARGSGTRSLSGMTDVVAHYRRPLLSLTRHQVREEVLAAVVEIWDDPHNEDPRFTRSRVRARVMPLLEAELGPGVEAALVRSARLLRDDADALDGFAHDAYAKTVVNGEIDIAQLMSHARALRTRVIKEWIRQLQLPPATADHIDAVEALASQWKGQGGVALPGHVDAIRQGGVIRSQQRG